MGKTQEYRDAAIATPLKGKEELFLVRMSASEALGRPFELNLELASDSHTIKAKDIVGQNITVGLRLSRDKTRYFNGYISRFTQLPAAGQMSRYAATAVPWLWFLTRTADCRIFQKKDVRDIIKEVFKGHGLTDIEDALTGTYSKWEYCVQYRETDFDFVSRLMEHEGIYYFFKHDNGKHELVLADSASAHKVYEGYDEVKYQAADTGTAEEEVITEWTVETSVQPGSYALRSFDFKNIKKDLHARAKVAREHEQAGFEVYDYPADYTESADADTYARARIEEFQAGYEVAAAASDVRGISTGSTFKLKGHPREDQNRKYLITSATYTINVGDFYSRESAGGSSDYSCTFTAIDAAQPFRPLRKTPRPKIAGPQTALVVGPSGEEIHTDEFGRVKVKFHWDRYSKADQDSSCWIRVAQVWAGKNWGAMYIPRIGQEVIVEFLEGDPDRPIITGRVYNDQAMPPYDLPAQKTKSTLKSNSSKGGGGFNEIRIEDEKGKEQVFIHAEKNQDVRVKNDTYEWIGNERHLIVKQDQIETVEGDKHSTVQGDRIAQVDGDSSLTVGGDHLTDISGDKHLTVGGDKNEAITGNHSLKANKNINEEAGQKISIKSGMDFHGKAGMNYAMDAGMAVHIKGGMTVVIEAGMQLSLKAGASFIDIGPAGVSISGSPTVLINSGGAAGSGSGSSPTAPTAPAAPDTPKEPTEADTAEAGGVSEAPKPPKPPKAVKFSPQATTLKMAAQDGTPFCEECEKAKKESSA